VFEPLKNVFDRVLTEKNLQQTFSNAEVCEVANRLLANEFPMLPVKPRAKFVEREALIISVGSSTIANEIKLREDEILRILKQRFPQITKIRCRVEFVDLSNLNRE